MNTTATTINYGANVSFDPSAIPQASLLALVTRGSNHYFGNEQSAKMARWSEKFAKEHDGVEPTDEQYDTQKEAFQADALKALLAGEIGAGSRGPAVDPIEAAMEVIARKRVVEKLKVNGIKTPKKDETVTLAGQEFTMDDLIDRQIAKDEAAIRKEATKAVNDAKKRREANAKAAAEAKANGKAVSVDDLI